MTSDWDLAGRSDKAIFEETRPEHQAIHRVYSPSLAQIRRLYQAHICAIVGFDPTHAAFNIPPPFCEPDTPQPHLPLQDVHLSMLREHKNVELAAISA